ncbi:MAG: 30S ribosomal protein S6 [Alphaproteobacteria bacterium]
MPLYECVVIARQDLSAQQAEGLTENVKQVVAEQGGNVGKIEYWGLRQMAYRIRKNRKGHYTLLNIDAPATAIAELERILRLNEDVLRHLVISVEELEEGPSVMMQRKGRDERRSRPQAPKADKVEKTEKTEAKEPAEAEDKGE